MATAGPLIGIGRSAISAGNFLLSSALLFSGFIFTKVKQFVDFFKYSKYKCYFIYIA